MGSGCENGGKSHGGGEKKLVLMREGLKYFYMAERYWKMVHTTKKLFSGLFSEWELLELADEMLKDPFRTYWMEDDKVSWKKIVEMKKIGGIRTERRATLLNVIVLTGIGMMKCKKEK